MNLFDLSLSSADGSINLHDIELTEREFETVVRVADLFAANDPGGYTPRLLVMRAPNDPGEWCDYCSETRPVRGGNK